MLLTVVALASAVALICAIDLANRAVNAAVVEVLDTMAGRASLQVSAGEGALVPEALAERVATVAGVELAVPVVSSSAFLANGSGEHLLVHGIDITNDDAIRTYEPAGQDAAALDDPLVFLNQRDSIMLTAEFAARHGLSLDEAVELETPTGRSRFVVRGLLASDGVARMQGGNLVVMDIASAQVAFTRPGLVNRIDVVVDRASRPDSVRQAILSMLPTGYRVDMPEQRRLDLHRIIQSLQVLFQGVSLLGLVAAFLIAFSRLAAFFDARIRQLAVLRAVGVRRGWVNRELLKESLLVGTAGIALGIPLGIALAHALLPVIATATAIGAKLVASEAVIRVRWSSVALAATTGMIAVLLAAVIPARRAARAEIVETLQGRTGAADGDASSSARVAVVMVCTLVAVVAHVVTGHAALGLAASGLLVVTAIGFSRPMVTIFAKPMARIAPRLGKGVAHFAIAALSRAPRRSALTVATLGVGFGAVLWLWTLATSFEQSVVDVMPGVLRGDLVVGSANVATGYIEAPIDESILGEIAATPGVRAVVGEQTADWTYGGGPIALNAFDREYFDGGLFGEWRFVGRALPDASAAVARGEAVLVSENLVHNVGGRVGDALTLDTPAGPMSLRVAGIVADFLSPRGTVILSRELYRERWRNNQVTHALVVLDPDAVRSDVRAALAARLGLRHKVRVVSIPELVDWFAEQARRAFASLHVLGFLVLIVVLVGVGDALAAGIVERTRDLGVVRALGARRRVVGRIVVGEALMLAVLGIILAGALGLGLGVMWVKATFPALIGWTLSLHLPLAQGAMLVAGACSVCLLASYLPARRAARLNPILAIRTE